jgi:hypothetical protein
MQEEEGRGAIMYLGGQARKMVVVVVRRNSM